MTSHGRNRFKAIEGGTMVALIQPAAGSLQTHLRSNYFSHPGDASGALAGPRELLSLHHPRVPRLLHEQDGRFGFFRAREFCGEEILTLTWALDPAAFQVHVTVHAHCEGSVQGRATDVGASHRSRCRRSWRSLSRTDKYIYFTINTIYIYNSK
jgi:hypothetical protein